MKFSNTIPLILAGLLCFSGCTPFVIVDKDKQDDKKDDKKELVEVAPIVEKETTNLVKNWHDIYDAASKNIQIKDTLSEEDKKRFSSYSGTMEWIKSKSEENKVQNLGPEGDFAKKADEMFIDRDSNGNVVGEKNLDKLPQFLEDAAKGFGNVID